MYVFIIKCIIKTLFFLKISNLETKRWLKYTGNICLNSTLRNKM